MIRVLFISSSLPPNYDSQTIRNMFLLKALDGSVYSVTLLVPDEKGVEDERLGFIKEKIYAGKGRVLEFETYVANSKAPKIIKYLVANMLMYLTVPDKYIFMKRRVVRLVSHLEFDVVVSASGAYSAHSWAAAIAKSRGVKHVAELGDPWSDNPIWPENMMYRRFINRKLERRALSSSSLISTTNESTSRVFRRKFSAKVCSLPMGYSRDELSESNKERLYANFKDIKRNCLNFSYIGVSFKKSRDLTPLIQVLGGGGSNLLIVGPHSDSYEVLVMAKYFKNVHFMDKVSYQSSLFLTVDSDISVVVGNTGALQIPGKLYLALGVPLPVLYITQCDADPAIALLDGLEGVFISDNTVDDIREVTEYLIQNYAEVRSASKLRAESNRIKEFEWGSIGEKFKHELLELER